MKLYVLFKTCFSWLALTLFWQGKDKVLPHYCQKRVEVQVPHLASVDTYSVCEGTHDHYEMVGVLTPADSLLISTCLGGVGIVFTFYMDFTY